MPVYWQSFILLRNMGRLPLAAVAMGRDVGICELIVPHGVEAGTLGNSKLQPSIPAFPLL